MDPPIRVKTEISCLNDHLQLHGMVADKACKGEFLLEKSGLMDGGKDHSWEGIAVFSIFTISALQNSTSAFQTSAYGPPYNSTAQITNGPDNQ
jgi:hypothetical protein